METVITRDTDIFREYLAALDARERGLSPFAKLAATVKLARLRRELNAVRLETTDEDLTALRREVDERLNRTMLRRLEAKPWGARLSVFLLLVIGQQLALALALLLTALFVQFAPTPSWWNPVLPHEEPVFLFLFIFVFFFAAPMLALLALFGGRYFRAWRVSVPATAIILALSALGTYLVVHGKLNPAQRSSSLTQLTRDRGFNLQAYRQWVDANWLMKDEKFQRDYEIYLRNGPGRWITSRFDSKEDAAWHGALGVIGEYLDGGHDPEGFREWLKYYFDRNRIYSEDRIDQEVNALAGEANQRFLGVWQVEPYLKERDERTYRAYLGSINKSMKGWGIVNVCLFTLVFLIIYLTGPALSAWERMSVIVRVRRKQTSYDSEQRPATTRAARLKQRYYSFPEREEIVTPSFFDTPFKLLSHVHRSFVRLVVFASIFVFLFWAIAYAIDLAAGNENAPSQVALMRSNLLLGGSPDAGDSKSSLTIVSADDAQQNFNYATATNQPVGSVALNAQGLPFQRAPLGAIINQHEWRLDETDYQIRKKFEEQNQIIASQRSEIDYLKSITSQLQQTTSPLPEQLANLASRANAAEARAGEVLGQVGSAKQQTENIQKQINAKLAEVEGRAARASEQIGKVEDQASMLATRTEALEKELDRRARQIEARTEELGERTAALKEREERISRLQRVAFAAILSSIKSETDDLDRRTQSTFYRFFNKGDARRDADSLRRRINQLITELREMNNDQAKQMREQLEELDKRVEQIAERVK